MKKVTVINHDHTEMKTMYRAWWFWAGQIISCIFWFGKFSGTMRTTTAGTIAVSLFEAVWSYLFGIIAAIAIAIVLTLIECIQKRNWAQLTKFIQDIS